eukprot:gene16603-18289_t
MQSRCFIKYSPPPLLPSGCGSDPLCLEDEVSEWKERMKYVFEDYDWLLKLSDERFAYQILKDETFNNSFESFLQFCPRYFDQELELPGCDKMQASLKKLVVLIILRIVSIPMPGDTSLYDNFILDIPKLFDICAIYGAVPASTKALIKEALKAIFKREPRYWDDLAEALGSFSVTLDKIKSKLGLSSEPDEGPKQLNEQPKQESSQKEIEDILCFIYDSVFSMASFLELFDDAADLFLRTNLLSRCAEIIDSYLPALSQNLHVGAKNYQRIFKRIKKCVVFFSHLVLDKCFLNGNVKRSGSCEEYLNTVASLLSYPRFIQCYEKFYGINADLKSNFEVTSYENDEIFQYILGVLNSLCIAKPRQEPNSDVAESGAMAAVSEIDIHKALDQIQNLFPNEDEGFLRAFIIYHDGSAERVINGIIEENIPLFLLDMKNKKHQHSYQGYSNNGSETGEETLPGTIYMKSRTGQKIPFSDIQNNTGGENLDWIRSYSLQQDKYDEYDDEYDDTYDSHNIGALDADSGDELKDITSRRSIVKPRVLRALEDQTRNGSDQSNSDSESDKEESISFEADLGCQFQMRYRNSSQMTIWDEGVVEVGIGGVETHLSLSMPVPIKDLPECNLLEEGSVQEQKSTIKSRCRLRRNQEGWVQLKRNSIRLRSLENDRG